MSSAVFFCQGLTESLLDLIAESLLDLIAESLLDLIAKSPLDLILAKFLWSYTPQRRPLKHWNECLPVVTTMSIS